MGKGKRMTTTNPQPLPADRDLGPHEVYKILKTIKDEVFKLYQNIDPTHGPYSQIGIWDAGYEKALDEATELIDKEIFKLAEGKPSE